MLKLLLISKKSNIALATELGKIAATDFVSCTHPIWHREKNRSYHPTRNSNFNNKHVDFLDEKIFQILKSRGITPLQRIKPDIFSIRPFPTYDIQPFLTKKPYHVIFLEDFYATSEYINIIRKLQPWALILTLSNREKIALKADFSSKNISEHLEKIRNTKHFPLPLLKTKSCQDISFTKINFRKVKKPTVSVIVLAHNSWEFTKLCLASLSNAQSKKIPTEYILFDNASNDKTSHEAERIPGLKYYKSDKNIGFAAGNNAAIKLALGDSFILLNNDTIVAPEWIDRLHSLAKKIPNLGAIGPSTNTESGQVPFFVQYNCIRSFLQLNKSLRAHIGSWEKTKKISGLCIYIPKATIQKIGFLDESFGIGYFEDDDYCLRIVDANLTLAWAKDTFVRHFGSASFTHKNRKKILDQGMQTFIFKWGKRALDHIHSVHQMSLLRMRKNKRNIQAEQFL